MDERDLLKRLQGYLKGKDVSVKKVAIISKVAELVSSIIKVNSKGVYNVEHGSLEFGGEIIVRVKKDNEFVRSFLLNMESNISHIDYINEYVSGLIAS